MLAKSRAQVLHQSHHVLLGGFWEIFFDIELTDGFAESTFGSGKGALPAGTLFFDTAHHLAEFKVGCNEVVTEHGGCLTYVFPEIVILDLAVG
ncbi:hypothetical protein IMSAGC006_02011 [Muribaculaceae bacterium]|nr:hypothetical protein IMSAGC006_02011 [Muribaculaceae bacterium]